MPMNATKNIPLNKTQKQIVWAITFGNILEWYDIYQYIYWAPTISNLFFNPESPTSNLFKALSLFALGYICRPLGGLFFGRLGDLIGRKKSFILSIILMTIPTFIIGLIPTYDQIGIFSSFILAACRVLQTFPAGGEIPGAFCFLYENAEEKNRKFMTSFAGVGNQIGIALSAIECLLLDSYLPEPFLTDWGWRISFILGGFIGLTGFYLRYKLHETKLFHDVVIHHHMDKSPLFNVLRENWRKIIQGIGFGASQTVSFHFISILFPVFFYKTIGMNQAENIKSSIIFMLLTTIPLPIIGFMSQKMDIKKLLVSISILMIFLLYPILICFKNSDPTSLLIFMTFYIICFTGITALWPYLISNLFPTPVRYTCLGLSFNICDGIFGGLSTLLTFYFIDMIGNFPFFIITLGICCLISLSSFLLIRESKNYQ